MKNFLSFFLGVKIRKELKSNYNPPCLIFTILVLGLFFGFSGEASAATAIYRSVGPGAVSDLNSNARTVEISGATATFSDAMPDNVGVGDVLQYQVAGTYHVAFISGRTSSTAYTVQSNAGGTPQAAAAGTAVSVYRAYVSLNDAAAGTENAAIESAVRNFDNLFTPGKDIVTADQQWNIACYNGQDGAADAVAATIYSSWVTDATRYVRIYTPVSESEVGISQRHDGKWKDTAYRMETTGAGQSLRVAANYTRIEGLQFSKTATNNSYDEVVFLNGNAIRLSGSIVKANFSGTSSNARGIYAYASGNPTIYIYNNALYDLVNGTNNLSAINCDSSTCYIYNNTIANSYRGVAGGGTGSLAINNVAQQCTDGFYGTFNSSSDYNLSNIASDAPGSHSKNSTTVTFSDYANRDLHLDSSDVGARFSGLDLTSNANLSFSIDIDGETRSGYWDIGADQFASTDSTLPTVTAFDVPAASSSLTVPVNSFSATDNIRITGYLLTESSSAPSAGNAGWSETPQTEYVFSSQGSKILYAWAKDAAGNISESLSDTVTITLPAYTIGGTISGLSGTVALQNNNGDDLSLAANGSFTFATEISDGGSYDVTVLTQPSGRVCTVSNGSGTVSGSDINDVSVVCDETGVTAVTSSGISGSGFPVALDTAGQIYRLSENITCDTTCFTVKADNITVDLNGHTATFGNANNPDLQNTGMENWEDAGTLSNWTVLSGTVTQRPAQVWGNYDAELSATASIKSDPVTLNAGQSYVYYAMIKGNSADSYDISLKNAADDTVLASTIISGTYLSRAFAMPNGVIGVTENEYKPNSNVSAYIQIDGIGTSAKRVYVADIKPAKHYFLTSGHYRSSAYYPDLSDGLFGGTSAGLTVKNGTINQGSGNAVKSAAIYSAVMDVDNVNISMSGNNTSSVTTSGSFTLNAVSVNTSSILNFNRMHAPASFSLSPAATGTAEIKGCTLLNDPEQAVNYSYSYLLDTDTHTTLIHDNTIRQKEQVTEGYAIALSGVGNVAIYNNNINPFRGRGILLDAVANRSGYLDGTKNVTIRNNTIQNIHEFITPEYGATDLEAAGIRVRDWGSADPPEGHRDLKVYENTISAYADAAGTHRSYGINITSPSAITSAEIYDNTITANLNSSGGSDWGATCISLQGADMSSGGSILIHNNVLTGNEGIRFGGNDGSSAKNIEIYQNDVSTDKAGLFYDGYLGPFADNDIYCNKLTNTSATGYPIYFEDGTPTVSGQYISNNLITNSNSGGHEVLLGNDYSSSVTSCGNGTLNVFGGGLIGSASDPCHNGTAGCYATAGLSADDTTSPVVTAFAIPATHGTLTVPVSSFAASDAVGVTGYKLTESATPPSAGDEGWASSAPTEYAFSSAGPKTLYAWAKDAAGNVSDYLSDQVTITLQTYAIGGVISGLSGTVVLQNDGGDNLTLTENGSFSFATTMPNGEEYDVAVFSQPESQTCAVASGSGVVSGQDVSDMVVTCMDGSDTSAPTVTAFSIPDTVASLTVPVSSFAASDAVGVTGYKLTESATPPSAGDEGWASSAPTEYAFSSAGPKTLYAWAKDAAGNVSGSRSANVTVIPSNSDEGGDKRGYDDLDISKVRHGIIDGNQIEITFKTNNYSKGTARFGTDKNLKQKEEESQNKKKHTIKLKNLVPGTKYYFRISAKDKHDQSERTKIYSVILPKAVAFTPTTTKTTPKSQATIPTSQNQNARTPTSQNSNRNPINEDADRNTDIPNSNNIPTHQSQPQPQKTFHWWNPFAWF